MRFGDDGIVSARHCCVVVGSSLWLDAFLTLARVLVEQLQERLICLMVEVMDLVSSCEQVRHSLRRRLVGDCRADNIRHVAEIFLGWYVQGRLAVETSECSKMDIASENSNAYTVLLRDLLHSVNQCFALLLVLVSCVVVVQIIEEIDATIKLVEHAASNTKALVEELDGANDGAAKTISSEEWKAL